MSSDILSKIASPEDLKGLSLEELALLSTEIREFLVAKVAKTGGHLGPNLGVVELTLALHRVFDSPHDRFVFDTGHANMGAGVENEFNLMKPRIRSTHVHDNNGADDIHLFPLVAEGGNINWKQAMALLRTRADHTPLLLELKEKPEYSNPIESAALVFKRLEQQ